MGSATGKNEGSFNTAVGANTLNDNTLGKFNTAAGSSAMGSNTSGEFNTAYGSSALGTNETGSNNTAVGASADVQGADLTNATVIGAGAKVAFSNTVRLGNADVTQVRTSGEFFSAGVNITSDRRLKTDIAAITKGLALINDLKPVTYRRINNITDDFEMGLLAQEVEEALAKHGIDRSGMVHQDSKDAPRYVRYTDLHAPVIRAIQELDDLMDARGQTISSLKSQLDAQADKIKVQEQRLNSQRKELLVILQSQHDLMAMQREEIAQLQRMVEHQFASR
jgi:type I site-specific restriction endonuclease